MHLNFEDLDFVVTSAEKHKKSLSVYVLTATSSTTTVHLLADISAGNISSLLAEELFISAGMV